MRIFVIANTDEAERYRFLGSIRLRDFTTAYPGELPKFFWSALREGLFKLIFLIGFFVVVAYLWEGAARLLGRIFSN